MSALRAAMRDASWYSKPQVNGVKKYHVIVDTCFSPCGKLLNEDNAVDAESVSFSMRCDRPRCRAAWPAAYRHADGRVLTQQP